MHVAFGQRAAAIRRPHRGPRTGVHQRDRVGGTYRVRESSSGHGRGAPVAAGRPWRACRLNPMPASSSRRTGASLPRAIPARDRSDPSAGTPVPAANGRPSSRARRAAPRARGAQRRRGPAPKTRSAPTSCRSGRYADRAAGRAAPPRAPRGDGPAARWRARASSGCETRLGPSAIARRRLASAACQAQSNRNCTLATAACASPTLLPCFSAWSAAARALSATSDDRVSLMKRRERCVSAMPPTPAHTTGRAPSRAGGSRAPVRRSPASSGCSSSVRAGYESYASGLSVCLRRDRSHARDESRSSICRAIAPPSSACRPSDRSSRAHAFPSDLHLVARESGAT